MGDILLSAFFALIFIGATVKFGGVKKAPASTSMISLLMASLSYFGLLIILPVIYIIN